MKPKIYTLQKPPVLGQLGDNTIIVERRLCDNCEWKELSYERIEYYFDYWSGEDLIKGSIFYLVSERLKNTLIENSISGCFFKEVISKKGPHFKIKRGAYSKKLPIFYQMIITGRAEGPEIWWQRIKCRNCEKKKWIATDIGIASMVRSNEEEIRTREVFFSSYSDDHIFLLDDPGPPIITEKFMKVLEILNVIGREFPEAKWA